MSVLHVFDMDGTLLRGTTASLEIARSLGCVDELQLLERDFGAGLIDTASFSKQAYRLWKGLTPQLVESVIRSAPWISGLREVLSDIRARGERSLVVTMSPDFFAVHLQAMGADSVSASRFPPLPFADELDPAGILCPADKVRIVDHAITRYGLSRGRCIAYGDSVSDIPLFQVLGCTVSVNGDAQLAPWSRLQYTGDDLRQAYGLARALFFDRSIG